MKKKTFGNSERRDALLEVLWSSSEPMSSQEILEAAPEKMVNITYVHRALNELLESGLIRENGTKRYNTQYARLFSCVYTKEEYAAEFMKQMGLQVGAIGKVALALANEKSDKINKDKLVNELEAVIRELKAKGE